LPSARAFVKSYILKVVAGITHRHAVLLPNEAASDTFLETVSPYRVGVSPFRSRCWKKQGALWLWSFEPMKVIFQPGRTGPQALRHTMVHAYSSFVW
jgi:hypothetical protein